MTGHEPAFPGGISATAKATDDAFPTQAGMSLRAYLAAKAMQGLCANPTIGEALSASVPGGSEEEHVAHLAFRAVEAADALIAELNKEGK